LTRQFELRAFSKHVVSIPDSALSYGWVTLRGIVRFFNSWFYQSINFN
jgi:hypothetical protein